MDFSSPFSIARLPRIEFGPGVFNKLPDLISQYGHQALLVTGARSFQQTQHWTHLIEQLESRGIAWQHCKVDGEPSPELVDEAVKQFATPMPDVVVGIGGGSALDAGKSIAGLLKVGDSVMDYLEGVGPERDYIGPAVPFIACPTTAGTGSEATKNGVLSQQGEDGFKKSFRDEQLVPAYAVVDPDLLASCPKAIIAANGMDALTQVLESFVSTKANPMTNALGARALKAIRGGLLDWYQGGASAAEARARMAYAALISGINLAQTGLGSVHGLASPLGAYFPIPHGVACGTLVASCTRKNIEVMLAREPHNRALNLYAEASMYLTGAHHPNREAAWEALIDLLDDWTKRMLLPRLSHFDIGEGEVDKIVANSRGSSMKSNPIVLSDDEIADIVIDRL
ncbi:MAG: iron-containing alcohol dehydrogenase [Gammaproteobacteria bacterium]